HTDINVKCEQHKKGRNISGFSFTIKQKKVITSKSSTTLELFSKMTDAQRHLIANKLYELPDMNKYSQGTESDPQFAVRFADMLKDKDKFEVLLPHLKKVGFSTK
ncbi:RepB family plasmid replication initiator protein, partial [Acinetobacter guillouiae]